MSRGMELLTEWVNGSYSDSMLPNYSNQPSLVEQLANAMQMHADVTQKYIALSRSKPEVSQPTYDMNIHYNPDAQAWAKFFMKTREEKPDMEIDESLMIGWFANAMMAMHDHIKSEPEVSYPVSNALLMQLLDSVEGNCYMGKEWELKTCQELRNSSPPDYEALKAENNLLKEVEKGFADLSENLQMDCATLKTMNTALRSGQLKISEERNALKLRVAELEKEIKLIDDYSK